MSLAILLPNADFALNHWIDQAGGSTNIYQSIDEGTTSPNDSDYIVGSGGLVSDGDTYKGRLTDTPGDFGSATGCTVKIRADHDSTKTDTVEGRVQVFASDGTTALTAESSNLGLTDSFQTFSVPLTITGATDKTSWDGAIIGIKVLVNGATGLWDMNVSAVQVEVTYSQLANIGDGTNYLVISMEM